MTAAERWAEAYERAWRAGDGEAAAEVRMDREVSEVGDPRAPVGELEAHRAGAAPLAVILYLDDETTELVGLRLGALDLLQQPVELARARAREVGLDVLVGRQLDEEVDVIRSGPAQPQSVTLDDAQGEGVAAAGSRRGIRTAPEPNATPPRISAMPTSSSTVKGSPSSVTP